MKRTLIILTVLAAISLTGCSEQKNERLPEIIETTEAPTEPVFMEYSDEDFTHIEVNLNKQQDTDPPVSVEKYDLKNVMVSEEIMSPCKLPENREKYKDMKIEYLKSHLYYEDNEKYSSDEAAAEEKAKERYNALCDEASVGYCVESCYGNGKIAYLVNYDDNCDTGSHCEKIYEYDLETKQTTELYSYEDDDLWEDISDFKYFEGDLYIIRKIRRYAGIEIETLDNRFFHPKSEIISPHEILRITESGKAVVINEFEEIISENSYVYFNRMCSDKMVLNARSYSENYDKVTDNIYEYDTESNELKELYSGRCTEFFMTGDTYVYSETDEDGKTSAVSNYFRLNTGIKGADFAAYSENRVAFIISDTMTTRLYTYDLDKMECYDSTITGVGDAVNPIGRNWVLSRGTSRTYLIPELGATFNIDVDASSKDLNVSGESGVCGNELYILYHDTSYTMSSDGKRFQDDSPLKKVYVIKP